MSMSNHPRLPLEVIEQIIDNVASKSRPLNRSHRVRKKFDDLPSVKTCALVCHSFLALSRKHIFDFVILDGRPISPTSDDLNHLLSNSPHLAVYIRKLVYYIPDKKEFVRKRLPWLTSMFKKLVKLQRLRIGYLPSGQTLDWMSPSARKLLLPLLHLSTLTAIKLFKFRNFALADLAGCVNLKKLQIGYLQCSTKVGKFLKALPAAPVMLEELAISPDNKDVAILHVERLCHARRPDGKPIFDLSSLKRFEATVGLPDSLTELFGMCTNLHKIHLTCMSLSRIPLLHPFDVSNS